MIISLIFSLFFLISLFFLKTALYALTRLGETRSLDILHKSRKKFYYSVLHELLFRRRKFELLVFSISLGHTLSLIGYTVSSLIFLIFFLPGVFAILAACAFLLLFLALLIGDFFPRLLTIRNPEWALASSAGYVSFFLYLCLPFSFFFLKLIDLSIQNKKKKILPDPFEDIKEIIVQILKDANISEKLNAADKKLIESVIKFKERIVREVMVPRVDLYTLAVETSIRQAAKGLAEEGYSRTPVYRENIDNIVGVLMFKDVLQLYMDCADGSKDASILNAPIETIIKNVFYTPETKKVSHLLQEFRTKQMHMAIVVDEYGGTEGVVTMEDILEEIVGEIADEYDLDEERLYVAGPGSAHWVVDARMSILDAEEIFGIQIPQEGDYDTIGGYIFHKMGSIPQKGLKIHHESFDLEILSSSDRSVEKVKITSRKRAL